MKLTKAQQKILDVIAETEKQGYELSACNDVNGLSTRAINSLIKKGLIKRVNRSRLRSDDNEMFYWNVYKVTSELLDTLE